MVDIQSAAAEIRQGKNISLCGKQCTSQNIFHMENDGALLYKFLCFKEAAKMPHLPKANDDQEKGLSHCPP